MRKQSPGSHSRGMKHMWHKDGTSRLRCGCPFGHLLWSCRARKQPPPHSLGTTQKGWHFQMPGPGRFLGTSQTRSFRRSRWNFQKASLTGVMTLCGALCAVWDSWSGSGLSMPPSLTKDPYSGQVLDCSVQRAHYCSSLLTGGPRRPFHCWLGQHLYCRGPYFTINHMQCSDFLTYLCFVTFQHLSLEGPNPQFSILLGLMIQCSE